MSKTCKLTGKRRNVASNVSHAHNRTKKYQQPNLQTKRVWSAAQQRMVRLRLSTRALRTVSRIGLDQYLRDNDLAIADIT